MRAVATLVLILTSLLATACGDDFGNAAYQRCLVAQSCDDYMASRGCDAEVAALTSLTC